MSRLATLLVLLAVWTSAACGAGGIRPRYAPFTGALIDTVPVPPDDAIRELQALVHAESLPIRQSSEREGYLETGWFNAETGRWGGGASLDTEAIIRIRFWSDQLREGSSIVVGEAVRRRVIDPSVAARKTQVPVPDGHTGVLILRRLLDSLRARAER